MPQSGKLPVLNLLTSQKSGFSSHRGDSWLCKISPQSPQGVGNAAPKYEKFPLFGKESPRRGDSLDLWRLRWNFAQPSGPTPVKRTTSNLKHWCTIAGRIKAPKNFRNRWTDSHQTWQGRRARGSAWLCKISPQSPQRVGMRPQKYQIFRYTCLILSVNQSIFYSYTAHGHAIMPSLSICHGDGMRQKLLNGSFLWQNTLQASP